MHIVNYFSSTEYLCQIIPRMAGIILGPR